MCDPLSLTIAATAVAALGQGVSAIGAHQQGKYEAKVAGANAKAESARAADAINRGSEESRRYQRRLAQEMGQQNAALAANGIDIGFGTAADVRGDTAMLGREDVITINENARREAMGFDINAMNFGAEQQSAKRRARGALYKGGFDIVGTVLGGAQQFGKISSARSAGGSGW